MPDFSLLLQLAINTLTSSSFSLARREKISERMRILQDLVPGCNKFLSMKLEAVNTRTSPGIEGFPSKDHKIFPWMRRR
ncbi:transcription factor BPE-like [Spinacia oleracea]|uniref:Transcription factor BPE-like n=1 Tax=Spinacia oleracea TaxID=3562 RepID=A0ABM3RMC7_SPIOL|nr:transcription factor BPE-like [Spinacia oleracea]